MSRQGRVQLRVIRWGNYRGATGEQTGASWAQGRPAKSTGLPSRLLGFVTPSNSLLGGRTSLLVLKKFRFWYLIFF